jgi:probable rRNA maturation factor
LRGQVTVLLTTDESIRQLNRRFRGKNKSTDVLSFPADGPAADGIAGDLAISVPTAQNQAREQGHRLITEIKVLILHGLLHLAGYDHEIDNGQMRRREALLRSRLNLPQGLIERTSVAPTKRSVRQASVSKKIKQASSKPRPKTRSKGPRP